MVEYRLSESNLEEYKKLFFYSFAIKENKMEQDVLEKMYHHAKVYGIKNGTKLMSSVMYIPFTTNFFGKIFKISSLANVMSTPENNNSANITELTKKALRDMYDEGITLSYLDPFSYSYYRRFGFEQVFELVKIKMPFQQVKEITDPQVGQIKRYKFSDGFPLIADKFEQNNRYGGIQESQWWWEILKLRYPDYYIAIYRENSEINGYLIYSFEKDKVIIHNFVYETTESYLALMKFIGRNKGHYQFLEINSDNVDLKLNVFTDELINIKKEISPFMMVRIVDLKRFVLNYPVQNQTVDKVTIFVQDSLDWNNYVWCIGVKEGLISFQQVDNSSYDIKLSIQTLTKAMFGYQKLQDSFLLGEVQGDLAKIKEVDKIFINERPRLDGRF